MQLDAEMVERALSDTIGIFRMAAEFLEVLDVFFFLGKSTPFRGGLVQCFGAHATRTAGRDEGFR